MIRILHTSDIHSNIENLSRISSYIKENNFDLILDAGDFCDIKNIMVNGSESKGAMVLMDYLNYDALTIGNNEFFQGEKVIDNLLKYKTGVLSCNLKKLDGSNIKNLQSHLLIEKQGLKILIIGVSPFKNVVDRGYDKFLNPLNLKTVDPYETIKNIIDETQHDICILLTHNGYLADIESSKYLQGVDIILGGHTHTLLDKGEIVNKVLIHHCGSHGEYLGIIEVEIENKKIISKKAISVKNSFSPDDDFMKLYNHELKKAMNFLTKPICYLTETLNYDPLNECDLVNVICDCLFLKYGGDLALINHGIADGEIKNEVSQADLLAMLPSPLNPVKFKLQGKQIEEAVLQSFNQDFCLQSGKGPGMRGKLLGTLAFSYNVEVNRSPFWIKINQEMLKRDKEYTVISDDYIQRGTGYNILKTDESKCHVYPGYIRDLLKECLCDENMLKYYKIKRVK